MPLTPLRLLHVADAALDRPLEETAALPDDVRQTVEDATLTALGRAVDAAVAQGVHAVLLSGETFRERDASLRARAALLDGLRKLAAHDIAALVVPGGRCRASAWNAIPDLPENVSICEAPGDPQAAANAWPIRHDERLVGTLLVGDAAQLARRDATPHTNGHAGANGNGYASTTPARVGVLTVCEPIPETAEADAVDAVEPVSRPSWAQAAGGMPSPSAASACQSSPLAPREVAGCEKLRLAERDGYGRADAPPSRRHATRHFESDDVLRAGRFDVLTVAGRESLPAGTGRHFGPKDTVPTACGAAAVPTRPQPLAPIERDASGAVVIEVSAGGVTRTTIATAPVRYHAVEIDVQPDTPRAEFVAAMAAAMSFPPVRPGEALRLVEWCVRGGGPLMDELHDADGRQLLIEEATLEADPPAEPRLEHRFRLIATADPTTPDASADDINLDTDTDAKVDTLAAMFGPIMAVREPASAAELSRRLSAHLAAVPADQQVAGASGRLLDLIAELDPAAVLAAAHRTGRDWLTTEDQ